MIIDTFLTKIKVQKLTFLMKAKNEYKFWWKKLITIKKFKNKIENEKISFNFLFLSYCKPFFPRIHSCHKSGGLLKRNAEFNWRNS